MPAERPDVTASMADHHARILRAVFRLHTAIRRLFTTCSLKFEQIFTIERK